MFFVRQENRFGDGVDEDDERVLTVLCCGGGCS